MTLSATPRHHFVSSRPFSGSTLLVAILRQSSRIQAGIASRVGSFVNAILPQISAGSEFAAQVDNAQKIYLLTGLFDSNCRQGRDKDVILETHRMWCAKLPTLLDLFPNTKVIASAHNVAWAKDSNGAAIPQQPLQQHQAIWQQHGTQHGLPTAGRIGAARPVGHFCLDRAVRGVPWQTRQASAGAELQLADPGTRKGHETFVRIHR